MDRRRLLQTALALPAALAAPRITRAAGTRVLKFVPQSDLTILDPIWTTAFTTRNHAFMVFDTLYGQDASFSAQPQMVAGHTVENDGKLWKLTLRGGLTFHDGMPVLARDCVASLRRWGKRDTFGQALFAVMDDIAAPDDKTIAIRLKQPFPLLPLALGKPGANIPVIMPERLAETDPFKQVTEMVGSGPFRFKADERVSGSRVVYERFDGYQPRPDGTASFTAGPKVAHFDRVEWVVIPDSGTAAAALQAGEVDWWELALHDLVPSLRRDAKLKVSTLDPSGMIGLMRPNHLFPPFDNPEFRRALSAAVVQSDFMTAAAGIDASMWHDQVGVFCPISPFATAAALSGSPDMAAVQRAVKASGYQGEKIVVLGVNDIPIVKALCDVGADLLQRAGLNVDYLAMDAGSMVQRRAKMDSPEQGGWSVFFTYWGGLDMFSPAVEAALRGNGKAGWFGWPTLPKLEQLRQAWLEGFCCILVLPVWLGTSRGMTRQRQAARVRQDQPFKGRQFTAEVILWAVRWYLMFPMSYRDLELMLLDRGVEVDHTTIFRWIQVYAAELEKRIRLHLRMSNGSWRVDETYVKVKGRWTYLYRAVDSRGQTIDFLLSAKRDAEAAKRFFRKALAQPHTVNPRTITVDKNAAYPKATAEMKQDGELWRRSRLRQVKYLNNIVEQDHRNVKRLTRPGLGFGSFWTARRTIAGYEAMAMIRKGQVRNIGGSDIRAQATFIAELFQMAA